MKKNSPRILQLTVFLLLLGLAGGLWLGQEHVNQVLAGFASLKSEDDKGKSSNGRAVPVVVEKVGVTANDTVIEAIATARARRFVTLYPEAEGEIVEFAVHAGDRVSQGDVILRLESRAAELAVELGRIKVEEMERMHERSRQLHRRNVNPEAKVEDSRTVLERAKVELKQAEETLSKRTLRAPFDGVVGIPKVELGDRVTTSTAIITVDDRSELLVEVEVPEQHLAHLEPGLKVTGRTPGFGERRFEGAVERIDSRIDPTSRTVMVRAGLPNPEDLLRPGMSFAVELFIPGETYPMVPELALQWRAGESYVWRIRDGVADKVLVRTIRRQSSTVLVDGELFEGDLVVVEGVQRLRQGKAVRFAAPSRAPTS